MNGGESGRSLRVLVLNQYSWPESFRINQLTKALIEVGCSVTVLTGQPKLPGWNHLQRYRPLRLGVERHPDDYKIYRVPLVPRGRATPHRLIANYVSFVLSAAVFGPWLLRKSSFDVVFVYAPSPILQGWPAIVIKWLRRAPLITWVPLHYLPATAIYCDDIQNPEHNQWQGELLKIDEFNRANPRRKISRFNFLRENRLFKNASWISHMFMLHVLDHPIRTTIRTGAQPSRLTIPYLRL